MGAGGPGEHMGARPTQGTARCGGGRRSQSDENGGGVEGGVVRSDGIAEGGGRDTQTVHRRGLTSVW